MTAPSELTIQLGFRNRLRYVAPAVHVVAIPNAAKLSNAVSTSANPLAKQRTTDLSLSATDSVPWKR